MTTPTVELHSRIGGRWSAGGDEVVESWNPAHPHLLVARGRAATADDLDAAMGAAHDAAPGWARLPAASRGAYLAAASSLLLERADVLGHELASEEGKTLAEGVGEVRRAAQILDYFSRAGDRSAGGLFHSPRAGERILVTRKPLGVVAVITPFNFPIAIPAWKIAPALVYGNTVVWKPAGTVPLLALRLTQALVDAGLPDGVLNLVLGGTALGSALVSHPGAQGITFTGSTSVGRSIAAAAAGRGVPVQAELGGKNAAVVLADADLDLAVAQVAAGAFNSSGQKCTATSRVLVDASVADEFLAGLVARADSLAVGDPVQAGTQLGPVITAQARDSMLSAVVAATADGARRLTERTPWHDAGGGHFVAPTVLDCSTSGSPIWDDELFGPILAVKRVDGAGHAFAEANRGEFGLTAAVFTSDLGTALEAVEAIDTGILHINSESAGADPHVPFGGAKGSGIGPKEQGEAAQEFFTHTQTVYLRGGSMTGPLVGLLVADFTRVLAGPYATMMLADMGAEVVKVERLGVGDETRAWTPPVGPTGTSTYFGAVNRNKRSIAVDLADPDDLTVVTDLVGHADVVIENFRPGTMDRHGLGPAEVERLNPRAVYCSISGFGAGAGAELPGFDLLVQAMGGLMSITGADAEHPTKVGVALVDVVTGLHALSGILAALHVRETSGKGQRIEVDLLSSLLSSLTNQAGAYLEAGRIPGPMGNAHPSIAPYETYRAVDRDIAIAVGTDGQFGHLADELGHPELARDPRFATNAQRVAHRAELNALLAPAFAAATADEWAARLALRRVPAGPINTLQDAFALAERLGLEPVVEIDGSRSVAHPIRFGDTPVEHRSAPPALPTRSPSSWRDAP